jgi:hypothetical protein
MKLRCPPRDDKHKTLSCGRCLRLRVNCVTSSPSLVRPPTRDKAQVASVIPDPDGPGTRPNQPPNIPPSAPELDFDSWDYSVPGGHIQDDISATSACFSSGIPSDGKPFFDLTQHEPMIGDLNLYDLTIPNDRIGSAYDDPAKSLKFSMAPVLTSDYRLANLHTNLCNQFNQYRAAQQNGSLDASTHDCGQLTDINHAGSIGPLHFGDALRCISELLGIIEDYGEEMRASTDHHKGSMRPPLLRIVIILDILSAYHRMLVIYDDLCAQLYDEVRACLRGSISGHQTLPGLQLAGHSVEHGHLQTKILVQAVIHHFEMIERALGLPIIYRVSSRQDIYRGLLEDDRCKRLLSIVMEDECGSRVLSLREKLNGIKHLIHL